MSFLPNCIKTNRGNFECGVEIPLGLFTDGQVSLGEKVQTKAWLDPILPPCIFWPNRVKRINDTNGMVSRTRD